MMLQCQNLFAELTKHEFAFSPRVLAITRTTQFGSSITELAGAGGNSLVVEQGWASPRLQNLVTFPFPHQWATAVPDNPSDLLIILVHGTVVSGAFAQRPIPDIDPVK
jgi:hypothetical protein